MALGEMEKLGNAVPPSDEDLIGALRTGNTDSLGVLVSRWERPLFRFVYRLLPRREEAQDICQETFLRILKKADRFRDGGKFSTWMYQIALNLCRDEVRHRRRWGKLVVENPSPAIVESAGTTRNPDGDLGRREEREAVGLALRQIPAEQREVLVLKEFQGLRFREIAEILGCPESTVKSRMYYGLRGLRSALLRAGFSDDRSGSQISRSGTGRSRSPEME